MRVTLLHKPSAGEGAHTRAGLITLFEEAGHAVVYRSVEEDGWPASLDAPTDCVAVAGGDGTVGLVATRLVGRSVPLAILPLGTANNIAVRLGVCRPPEEIVAGLAGMKAAPFDVGVAQGPWGERRFIEGVGLGAFPRAMAFIETAEGELVPDPSERNEELDRDLRLLRAFLNDLDARRCTLTLDGDTQETSYVLLEVTNTGLIGPNVELAPQAACGDGLLDVVVAGDAERERLVAYLEARLAGEEEPPLQLPVRRAQTVQLTVEAARVHIDGATWPEKGEPPPAADAPFDVTIRVEPGALDVLVPA